MEEDLPDFDAEPGSFQGSRYPPGYADGGKTSSTSSASKDELRVWNRLVVIRFIKFAYLYAVALTNHGMASTVFAHFTRKREIIGAASPSENKKMKEAEKRAEKAREKAEREEKKAEAMKKKQELKEVRAKAKAKAKSLSKAASSNETPAE